MKIFQTTFHNVAGKYIWQKCKIFVKVWNTTSGTYARQIITTLLHALLWCFYCWLWASTWWLGFSPFKTNVALISFKNWISPHSRLWNQYKAQLEEEEKKHKKEQIWTLITKRPKMKQESSWKKLGIGTLKGSRNSDFKTSQTTRVMSWPPQTICGTNSATSGLTQYILRRWTKELREAASAGLKALKTISTANTTYPSNNYEYRPWHGNTIRSNRRLWDFTNKGQSQNVLRLQLS